MGLLIGTVGRRINMMIKFLKWCKERLVCLLGLHGFNCKEDVVKKKCSYCGCHFEGWLPKERKS